MAVAEAITNLLAAPIELPRVKLSANWMLGEVSALVNRTGLTIDDVEIPGPCEVASIVNRIKDGTISRWREDALAVIDALTDGPLVLVGSSMGGWLSCLAAIARPDRVKAMVLIAPAPDFTEKLMEPELSAEARAAIARDGFWIRPSDYDDGGYAITRELLEDGARWSILPGPVPIDVPVRVLQGGADPDVPWTHALELANALTSDNVVFSLIKDGDHRLSRPQDLERLVAAVSEAKGLAEPEEGDLVSRRLARAARLRNAAGLDAVGITPRIPAIDDE